MFGLMKSIKNSTSNDEYRKDYRLHYCGTCKTMGKKYGQRTRVLLNHDVVFLGQLLSAFDNEEQDKKQWDSQYFVKKCFALPKKAEKIPKVLEYTAAINVMLGALKIEDNILDSKKGFKQGWKTARSLLKSKVKKTEKTLLSWSFPVNSLWEWIGIQLEREVKKTQFNTITETLNYYAEPTAMMTALVFKHGAKMTQHPSAKDTLFDIGHSFGQLIYWLDALDDFEKDAKEQKFNGIQAVYNTNEEFLNETLRLKIIQLIRSFQADFDKTISKLPMEDRWKVQFSYQLNRNLSLRLDDPSSEKSCNTSTSKVIKPLPSLELKVEN